MDLDTAPWQRRAGCTLNIAGSGCAQDQSLDCQLSCPVLSGDFAKIHRLYSPNHQNVFATTKDIVPSSLCTSDGSGFLN